MLKFLESIDVTVTVSLIAAIAAIISPCVTEILRQRGIRREKSLECYFAAKTEAYKNYLRVVSRLHSPLSPNDFQELSDVMNQALIFSSRDTGRKIICHVKCLERYNQQELSDDFDWSTYEDAYTEMLSALHLELENYCK